MGSREKSFETFEHGADVGIRGYGETPEEALSNLLKALASLLVEEPLFLKETPTQGVFIKLTAEFLDELLVMFVNKVLSISALEGIIFYDFQGSLNRDEILRLEGELRGVPLDPIKYGYGVEVKGATFTLAKFEKINSNYVAQCVVDV